MRLLWHGNCQWEEFNLNKKPRRRLGYRNYLLRSQAKVSYQEMGVRDGFFDEPLVSWRKPLSDELGGVNPSILDGPPQACAIPGAFVKV